MLKSFTPGTLWPDENGVHINAHGGGFLHYDSLWYWYGEHKIAGEAGNLAHVGIHVYSSPDLLNWTDRGIALDIRDGLVPEFEPGCVMERPKVLYCQATGRFVMWFHYENGAGYRSAMCGVATADSPEGPFRYFARTRPDIGTVPRNPDPRREDAELVARSRELGPEASCGRSDLLPTLCMSEADRPVGQQSRDMTLFQDDDGKAYLIYSSENNSTLHISELDDEYTGCSGNWARAFEYRWMEAPALFKRGGRYYLIASDCTGWAPNPARSAVADSIFGPWTELGNPALGPDADTTFHSQSTFVLQPSSGVCVYCGDRWCPEDAGDGRYVWLPLEFEEDRPVFRWREEWRLAELSPPETFLPDEG